MIRSLLERYGLSLAILSLFLIPFKLSFGYIGLIPLILLWIAEAVRDPSVRLLLTQPPTKTFFLFCFVAIITSAFGIDPARSYAHIGTLIFFPLAIAAFYTIAQTQLQTLIFALATGQALAGLSSMAELSFTGYSPPFLGPVTQSGQITLSLFCTLALILSEKGKGSCSYAIADYALGFMAFGATICFGLSTILELSPFIPLTLLLVIAIVSTFLNSKAGTGSRPRLCVQLLLPIIAATLILNLKRGPWVGVFVSLTILCLLYRPRWVLLLLATCLAAAIFVKPVQSRLLNMHDHFFIAGGRSEIWQIGGELAEKYPLGIGFENSGVLRDFSNEIPKNLKHFHNNFLNLLVETGWAGLFLYLISFYQFLAKGFVSPKIEAKVLALGLLAWQIAGVVEYNFGDSAVVSVAYFSMAALLVNSRESHKL